MAMLIRGPERGGNTGFEGVFEVFEGWFACQRVCELPVDNLSGQLGKQLSRRCIVTANGCRNMDLHGLSVREQVPPTG